MAASRTLQVTLIGDERDLSRAFRRSARDSRELGKTLGDVRARTAVAAGGLTLLAGKAVQFGRDSAQAAIDAEASSVRVARSVKNAGVAYEAFQAEIDRTIQAQSRLSGFDDEDLADSFGRLIGQTRNVAEALKLNALAADVARGRQIDLAAAQGIVSRAYNGQLMSLKRLGILIPPVTTAQDKLRASTDHATAAQKAAAKEQDRIATRQAAIAELTRRFGGQAREFGDTTAGAVARAQVAWENLQEEVGGKVAPAFGRAVTAILDNADALGTVARVAATATAAYGGYRGVLVATAGAERVLAAAQAARARLESGLSGVTLATAAAQGVQARTVTATATAWRNFVPTLAETVNRQATMRAAFVAWSPAATAAAAQTGRLSAAFTALSGAMRATPIGVVVGAVAGLAAAYSLLRDRTSAAEAWQKRFAREARESAEASRAAAAAIRDQAAATDRLRGANVDVDQAKLDLASAAARERATRGTRDHAQALIDLRRAQIQVRDATRGQRDATEEAVKSTQKATRETKHDVATAREHKDALELAARVAGSTMPDALKRVRAAQDEYADALKRGERRHREIAAEARRQAGATDTATAAGRRLKAQLEAIAQTNVSAASAISAFGAIRSAADGAAAAVQGLIDRLSRASTAPRPSSSGAGGGGARGGGGGGGQVAKERGSRGRGGGGGGSLASLLTTRLGPAGTVTERAGARITAIGRGSGLQEDQARTNGEAGFRAAHPAGPGQEVNPDAVRLAGEQAALAKRRQINRQEQGIIKSALIRVRGQIKAKRRELRTLNQRLDKLKKPRDKKAQGKWAKEKQGILDAIQRVRGQLEALYGDESNLMAQGADLVAEASQLDFDAGQLEAAIRATPALQSTVDAGAAGDTGSGGGDTVGAGGAAPETPDPADKHQYDIAVADRTPDAGDDVSARQAYREYAQGQHDQAVARGDWGKASYWFGVIGGLDDSIRELTTAVKENTEATQSFTGTMSFGFRGQSYVVGQSSDTVPNIALGV
ncbi:MAG: hypothetical protein AB1416_08230 [Actinomycetota bacterium]